MDWSNDMVLEFLQYYEDEPIIWNPRNENHKKKNLVNDAWRRIKNNLTWESNIDELKKKKDSLMAYYRIHLTKIKKSKLSGAGADDAYTTNWFAFAPMDNFLRPIYECHTTICTEKVDDDSQLVENNENDSGEITQQSSSTQQSLPPSPQTSSSESFRQPLKRKQLNIVKELSAAKLQMTEAFEHIKRNKPIEPSPAPKSLNEYEIFGNLVATKIQKIKNPLDREELMNNISNLIFKAVKSSITSQQSSGTISCPQSPVQLETYSPEIQLETQLFSRPQSGQSFITGPPTSHPEIQLKTQRFSRSQSQQSFITRPPTSNPEIQLKTQRFSRPQSQQSFITGPSTSHQDFPGTSHGHQEVTESAHKEKKLPKRKYVITHDGTLINVEDSTPDALSFVTIE